jgi:hypothetical protein
MEDTSCRLSVWTSEEQGLLQRLDQVLPQQLLAAIARQTGSIQRQRKIEPMALLGALCLLTLHNCCSFRMAAMFTGLLGGCVLSKQALAKRINQTWVDFLCSTLGLVLSKTALLKETKGIFGSFKRVILQDSTKLALPDKLASHFPGSRNQTQKQNAMISVQTLYDLLSERYLHFNITPFTYNDQRAARNIVEIATPGDLIIRDLGYFVLKVFRAIIGKGAYFLSRYHHGADLVDGNGAKFHCSLSSKRPRCSTHPSI